MLYIIISLFIIISSIILIKIFIRNKIKKLENNIISLLRRRTNQIFTIKEITKKDIVKQDEVFKSFIELSNIDFWNNSKESFENTLKNNAKIHKEIEFIFNISEKHRNISKNEKYNYIKESIIEKSEKVWKLLDLHKKISSIYSKINILSKILIIWFII